MVGGHGRRLSFDICGFAEDVFADPARISGPCERQGVTEDMLVNHIIVDDMAYIGRQLMIILLYEPYMTSLLSSLLWSRLVI